MLARKFHASTVARVHRFFDGDMEDDATGVSADSCQVQLCPVCRFGWYIEREYK